MSRFITLSLISFACSLLLSSSLPPHPDDLRWYTMEEVIQIKKDNPEDGKFIFIDVYTDWCGWCKRMDATTFTHPEIVETFQQYFYPVKFDGEARRDIQFGEQTFKYVAQGRRGYHELAAALLQGKLTYPTVVFMDEGFNMIQPLAGYQTPEQLLPILHFIGSGSFRNQPWEEFMAAWKASAQN